MSTLGIANGLAGATGLQQRGGTSMPEMDGVKMRIIALDELMKSCVEIGRTSDKPEHKEFAKALYEAARTRHDFLKSSVEAEK